ncbi:hypothetical protein HW556_08330 [Hymenobacter sp. P5252]|uniref:Uncharacterized protein n=2 Tax=Hymenobacter terrestris TaxID=2748310 RepID=A0ABX2Q1T6_9BACT|nr:hypothetical protein [Hymenobacter terrestris]
MSNRANGEDVGVDGKTVAKWLNEMRRDPRLAEIYDEFPEFSTKKGIAPSDAFEE